MIDIVERLRNTSEHGIFTASLTDNYASYGEAADAIVELRAALEPFAAMGRVMETRARVTFGKMPKDSEIVCESSGEAGMGILTMGHFRDAAATLPDAPGWGGFYKPLPIRAAHQGAGEP